MAADNLVVGHFRFVDDTLDAIRRMKALGLGLKDLELYSPVPNHDLEDELYKDERRSPVRMFTLFGGLLGVSCAFLMTIWMSLDYPIRVSAKPIVSIPAFVVIGFECTILFGGIFTLLGLLHNCRIPWLFGTPGYRPQFSKDVFGLIARVPQDRSEAVKGEMKAAGAQQIEIQYVR